MKKKWILLPLLAVGTISLFAQTTKEIKDTNDSLKLVQLPELMIISSNITGNKHLQVSPMELKFYQAPTLGETLSKIPGIQSTSFGPGAGAPMIRSLSGNRIKILSNGVRINDMSGISPDFNVLTNLDNVHGIEVYKNNASVLYGGGAVGGAINIRSKVIPIEKTFKRIKGVADVQFNTNLGYKQMFNLRGDVKNWTWTVGANHFQHNRIKIPGNSKADMVYDKSLIGFNTRLQKIAQIEVETQSARNITLYPYIYPYTDEELKEMDLTPDDRYTTKPEYFDNNTFMNMPNKPNPAYIPNQPKDTPWVIQKVNKIEDYGPVKRGEITNSFGNYTSIYGGTAYHGKSWNVGVGYQGFFNYYGLPIYALSERPVHHHGGGHTHGVSPVYKRVNIRNTQHQWRARAEFFDLPLFTKVNLEYAGTLANDRELLNADKVTQFNVNQQSVRLEMREKETEFLKGISGIDYNFRKIDGEGKMRFMPNNLSNEWGVFTQQNLTYKWMGLQMGYRLDEVKRKAIVTDDYKRAKGLAGGKLQPKHFILHQINVGLKSDIAKLISLSLSYNHSERAPQVNELYAGNDHFAIATEENGDDRLKKELCNNVELEGTFNWKGLGITLNLYHSHFSNYIYLGDTGISRGGFVVREWRAAKTAIEGLEGQIGYTQDMKKLGKWKINSYFDLVKNMNKSDNEMRKFSEGDYMPNMPTSRFGISLNGEIKHWNLNLSFDRYLKQKYIGKSNSSDIALPSYNLMNARIAYSLNWNMVKMEYYISGTNLLNNEARPQNSILKFVAPLPGRNISLGIRVEI